MDDRRLWNASLAAALAVKSALIAANTRKSAFRPKVSEIATEAAMSQGAGPVEAATIGLELERLSRSTSPEELPRDEIVGGIARAAMAVAENGYGSASSYGSGSDSVQQTAAQAPPIDPIRLYRALSQVREWCPLGKLARDLGLEDASQLAGQLEPLASEGFVRIENEHVWVTERGRRYLEYAPLT
jgi:hypothetical protein